MLLLLLVDAQLVSLLECLVLLVDQCKRRGTSVFAASANL